MKLENTKAQMKKGILELCVLSIISDKEMYPSDIITQLKKAKLIVVEGTLYPLLNRLLKADLLSHSWKESKTGPPRKYYKVTETGMEFKDELVNTWEELNSAVNSSINKKKK